MYRKRVQGWLKHGDFLVFELLSFQLAFLIGCILRHGFVNPYTSVIYRNVALVAALIQIFVIITFEIFHNVLKRGYYQEFVSSVKTVFMVMLLVVFYLFVVHQGGYFSRIVLIATSGFYMGISYFIRILWKFILRGHILENYGKKSMCIITSRERAEQVIENVQKASVFEFQIRGIILVDENQKEKQIMDIPVVATRENAVEYICRGWVDEVFVNVSSEDEFLEELINVMLDMNMTIHLRIGNIFGLSAKKKYIQKFGNYTTMTMSPRVQNIREALIKRTMDIFGGLIGCLMTGIIFIFLAPAICVQSPGPVLFSQQRVGRNGKLFRIYKFRSMYMDAEERKKELESMNEVEDGMMFKMENDPRIIGSEKGAGKGLGNFIRKTSLDEFPQFFNILKGDMSLVGTRPPTLDEWEKYHPHHRGRLSIKPGLTGLWQVSGRSDIQDFEEVVELDKKYIAEWSVGEDIKILLKTLMVVVKGVGAK